MAENGVVRLWGFGLTRRMPERQLRLFAPPKPLLEALGRDFFRSLPKRPGVYQMFDRQDRLLYVGQSKNLRQRLSSYKHIYPETASRRLIRLVHAVRRIDWEEHESVESARLKENLLLRSLRPRFNRMNTYPRAYFFVGVKQSEGTMSLCLTRRLDEGYRYFGAFKTGALPAFGSLLRLLWMCWHQEARLEAFPCRLLTTNPPRAFVLHEADRRGGCAAEELEPALARFFDGSSHHARDLLAVHLPDRRPEVPFQEQMIAADLQTLFEFHERGPRRNRQMIGQATEAVTLIAPEELDDLLVREAARAAAAMGDRRT